MFFSKLSHKLILQQSVLYQKFYFMYSIRPCSTDYLIIHMVIENTIFFTL
jgi:hypothetical protein